LSAHLCNVLSQPYLKIALQCHAPKDMTTIAEKLGIPPT